MKPGTAEQFIEAFRPPGDTPPAGWVRFYALRSLADENEVVTFGFFDGTLDELERSQQESDYYGLRDSVEPMVDAVIANGVYEVIMDWAAD